LVEHVTENHGVGGSIPSLATCNLSDLHCQLLVHERVGCKVVASGASSSTSSAPLRFAGSQRPYVSTVSWMLALHLVDCRALILTSLEGEAHSAPSSGPQSPSRQYRWPSLQQSRPEWSRSPCPYRSPGRSSRQSHRSRTCTKQPDMPTRSAKTVRVDRIGFIFLSPHRPHREDTRIGRRR
jgi:hypothetical protein